MLSGLPNPVQLLWSLPIHENKTKKQNKEGRKEVSEIFGRVNPTPKKTFLPKFKQIFKQLSLNAFIPGI